MGASEAILRLIPLPDPYEALGTAKLHRFLMSWNWWVDMGRRQPPFSATLHTGPLAGVSTRRVQYRVNRFGYLYPEERAKRANSEEFRIGVIGGSTVECVALATEKTWPAILESILKTKYPGKQVSVINLGVSGQASASHLATTAYHAIHLDLDLLIFLVGANDMHGTLLEEQVPFFNDQSFFNAADFSARIDINPWKWVFTRLQLGRRIQVAWRSLGRQPESEPGESVPFFAEKAKLRLSSWPPLTLVPEPTGSGLRVYERSIRALYGIAKSNGIQTLFLTQPTLWKERNSSDEESTMWLAGMFQRGEWYRLETGAAARMLNIVNRKTLEVCSSYELTCFDLASVIPSTLEYFYDDLHFNERGAAEVAHVVAEAIGARTAGK